MCIRDSSIRSSRSYTTGNRTRKMRDTPVTRVVRMTDGRGLHPHLRRFSSGRLRSILLYYNVSFNGALLIVKTSHDPQEPARRPAADPPQRLRRPHRHSLRPGHRRGKRLHRSLCRHPRRRDGRAGPHRPDRDRRALEHPGPVSYTHLRTPEQLVEQRVQRVLSYGASSARSAPRV